MYAEWVEITECAQRSGNPAEKPQLSRLMEKAMGAACAEIACQAQPAKRQMQIKKEPTVV